MDSSCTNFGILCHKRVLLFVTIYCLVFLLRKPNGNEQRKLPTFNNVPPPFQPSYLKDYRVDYKYSHPMDTDAICHLPYTVPDNYDIRYYLESRENFNCPPSNFTNMVRLEPNGTIYLHLENTLNNECFYRPLSGTLYPNANQVRLKDGWTALKNGLHMNIDQFVVRCIDTANNNRTIFSDAFSHISDKKFNSTPKEKRLNVVLLVLDSVSKSQFLRYMPKSTQFFDKHDMAFMHGYTANSHNTDINMMSMLSAKIFNAKKYGFTFEGFKYWMNVNLKKLESDLLTTMNPIFVQAQKHGYVTMYNEDIIKENGGLFHERYLSGYAAPPANYYYRPFYQYLYSNFQNGESKICLNGKLTGHRTLDLMDRFSTKYRDTPHFSFNFVGTAHENPNDLQLLDEKLAIILQNWEETGILEQTVFILAGNHGQVKHPVHETFHGRVEERNPVLIIHMPKKLKEERPEDVRMLKINENRITTHIDVYETMRELMHITSENITGRPLFTERPPILTCMAAQVPYHMCPCWVDDGANIITENNRNYFFIPIQNHIERIIREAPCIKEYYMLIPNVIETYSLASEMYTGERNLTFYRKRDNFNRLLPWSEPKPFLAEYVTFVTSVPMTAVWQDGTKSNFLVRSRMAYNKLTHEMQHPIKPFLDLENCEENILENICNCV